MKELKRYLATLIALCALALGTAAVAQKNDPKPPPKGDPKDVPTQQKPPPREDHSNKGGNNNGDKRGGRPF